MKILFGFFLAFISCNLLAEEFYGRVDLSPEHIKEYVWLYSGEVDLKGQRLLISFRTHADTFSWDSEKDSIGIGMDANLNGRIESSSKEMMTLGKEMPVFKVGDRYLSIKSVDVDTGDVVLETRSAADYKIFDAKVGVVMPNFKFTTLQGDARQLSDFRGKWVLLDFWGTWCGPCKDEMDGFLPLYNKYKDSGFEIIGMNIEKTRGDLTDGQYADGIRVVKTFVRRNGYNWIHATQQSIEYFALKTINISNYPTCILIDPEGVIRSMNARHTSLPRFLSGLD